MRRSATSRYHGNNVAGSWSVSNDDSDGNENGKKEIDLN